MTVAEAPALNEVVSERDIRRVKGLACPRCRAALSNPTHCKACDTWYQSEDGVLDLKAPGASAEVRLLYEADDGSTNRILEAALMDPPLYDGHETLPYHLDPAHARVLAELPPGSRVLEIGCGGGQNRGWMTRHDLSYIGTDLSRTRVFDWLQKYGGPDLLCDAHFLPFQDGQFDAVYSAATTEHLACPQRVVREVFRVLKPGGLFLGNVSFLEAWHDDSYFHMSPLGVCELLADAGFTVENVWPGRRYSGFTAIPSMGFRGPFKLLRYVGRGLHGMYRLQCWMRNRLRGFRGLPLESSIRQQAVVAGAIDWIARREGASP